MSNRVLLSLGILLVSLTILGFAPAAQAVELANNGFELSNALDGDFSNAALTWAETDTLTNIWTASGAYVNQGVSHTGTFRAVFNSVNDSLQVDFPGLTHGVGNVSFWYKTDSATDLMVIMLDVGGVNQWAQNVNGTTAWTHYSQDINLDGDLNVRWWVWVYSRGAFLLDDVVITGHDLNPPTATVTAVTTSPTNQDTLTFDVQFNEKVVNFTLENDLLITKDPTVSYTNATITAVSGKDYTVTVNGVSGDGNLTVAASTSALSDIRDVAQNLLASSTSATILIDNTLPDATVTATTLSPTNADILTFNVHFSEPVLNFTLENDLVITKEPATTVNYANATITPAGGNDYTVSVNGVSGDGNLTVAASLSPLSGIQDLSQNLLGSSTSATILMDNTPPQATVTAVTTSPTNADIVAFNVHFSEAVVNFTLENDLLITKPLTVSYTNATITPAGGNDYTVEVNGVSGDGNLTLAATTLSDIQDTVQNPLASSTSATILIDNTLPAASITAVTPSPTNQDTLTFNVHFNEDVVNFSLPDDLLVTTDPAVSYNTPTLTAVGPRDYTVDFTSVSGDGNLTLAANTLSDIQDMAQNPLASSTSATILIDNTPPEATVTAVTSSPTKLTSLTFNVHFSESVGNFSLANDLLITTDPTVYFVSAVIMPASGNDYTVYINGVSGDGGFTLAASTSPLSGIQDTAHNPLLSSSPATIMIDNTPPEAAITLLSPSPTGANIINFLVQFNEAVAPTFAASDVMVFGMPGVAAISGTDPIYNVSATVNPDQDGQVGILLMGGAGIADLAGNSYGGGVSDMCDIFNWRGFLAHPQDARKYTGDPHSFSVAVDCGSPTLVYQWKWNDGVNPVFDVGANAPSFPIANVALAHAGEFWCAVSYDGETYESNAGLLEVADHLQITNQPVGIDVKNETAYTLAVITSGGFQPLRYQWKLNGVRLPATSRTYTIPSLRTTDSGDYTVEIADDYADVVVSEAATLNVTITVPATGSMGLIVLSMLTAIAAAAAILGKRAKRRQRSR